MDAGGVGFFGPMEASVRLGDQKWTNGVQGTAPGVGDYGSSSRLSFDGGDSEILVLGINERPAALEICQDFLIGDMPGELDVGWCPGLKAFAHGSVTDNDQAVGPIAKGIDGDVFAFIRNEAADQ